MKKSLKILIGIVVACSIIGITIYTYQFIIQNESEEATVLTAEEDKYTIFTSILPQEYFVERIGGDRVEVKALVSPGNNPATYEPTPRQMANLAKAKIFFRIGVPFENAFLPKIEGEGLRIVDTRKGITLRKMKSHHHNEYSHKHEHENEEEGEQHHKKDEDSEKGDEEHHHDTGNDPHIWLSPRLVKIQARTITDALIEVDPIGREVYEKNLVVFLKDLDALDTDLAKVLAPVKGKTLMVFHPAWGYLADDYGLDQKPIEIEGKNPSAKQLTRMIEIAKEEGVRVIFVQPQFNKQSAQRIAEAIGGVVVPLDPLARDYVGNMKRVAEVVQKKLQKQEKERSRRYYE